MIIRKHHGHLLAIVKFDTSTNQNTTKKITKELKDHKTTSRLCLAPIAVLIEHEHLHAYIHMRYSEANTFLFSFFFRWTIGDRVGMQYNILQRFIDDFQK